MKTLRFALVAVVCCTLAARPAHGSAPPEAQAVLAQEARWVKADQMRDPKSLSAILADNFVHINFQGVLSYKEQTVANVTKPRPYAQNTTEQTVDFVGGVAIVHGVNVITQSGKVVLRLRYTDIYKNQNGQWLAVSAQETAIAH